MNGIPVTLVGNMTRDPEFKALNNGALLIFSVATERGYRGRDGEWVSQTSFVDVKAWSRVAEDAGTPGLLAKGVPVIVTGRLEQESWEAEDGTKRSKLVVVADSIGINVRGVESFVRKRREPVEGQAAPASNANRRPAMASTSFEDEPF